MIVISESADVPGESVIWLSMADYRSEAICRLSTGEADAIADALKRFLGVQDDE